MDIEILGCNNEDSKINCLDYLKMVVEDIEKQGFVIQSLSRKRDLDLTHKLDSGDLVDIGNRILIVKYNVLQKNKEIEDSSIDPKRMDHMEKGASLGRPRECNKKVSAEWIKEYNIKILDPDGWDRQNYNYSFNEEKITRKEFEQRLIFSTIQGFNYDNNGKISFRKKEE